MTFQQLIGTMTGRFGKLPNPENAQVARKCAAEGIVLLARMFCGANSALRAS